MSLLKSQSPFKTPTSTHTQSCLPLPNQASQGDHLSKREIGVRSLAGQVPVCIPTSSSSPCLARLLLLIQNHVLMVGGRTLLHPFKPHSQDHALLLHGWEASLSPKGKRGRTSLSELSYSPSHMIQNCSITKRAWLRERERAPSPPPTTWLSPSMAGISGFKSQRGSSSVTSFPTSPFTSLRDVTTPETRVVTSTTTLVSSAFLGCHC